MKTYESNNFYPPVKNLNPSARRDRVMTLKPLCMSRTFRSLRPAGIGALWLIACLFLLGPGIWQSRAQTVDFDTIGSISLDNGSGQRSVSVTGIRYGAAQQNLWSMTDNREQTLLESKQSWKGWYYTRSTGGVRDFEATFEIRVDNGIVGGGFWPWEPAVVTWGDGWAFVYGSGSQFESWTKSGAIEDGKEMTLAAGMQLYGDQKLFISQNCNSPNTANKSI